MFAEITDRRADPNLAARTNFDLYPLAANPDLWAPLAAPQSGNLGWLVGGSVEVSQFDSDLFAKRAAFNFFFQGPLDATTNLANLGLIGLGFFTVRDPSSSACLCRD